MKCEICENQEATVHFKQVCNGKVREMYVCEACAAENGFDLQSPLSLPDLLFGHGLPAEKQAASIKACPVCGMKGAEFKKRQLLGCPSCYETFAEELMPYLRAMQKGARHVGKAPAGAMLNAEIAALQKALETAVGAQDFEEAAQLRDRIRDLQSSSGEAAATSVAGEPHVC